MLLKIGFFIGAILPIIILPLPLWLKFIIIIAENTLPVIGSIISLIAWFWAAYIVIKMPFSYLTILFILAGIFGIAMNLAPLLSTFEKD